MGLEGQRPMHQTQPYICDIRLLQRSDRHHCALPSYALSVSLNSIVLLRVVMGETGIEFDYIDLTGWKIRLFAREPTLTPTRIVGDCILIKHAKLS